MTTDDKEVKTFEEKFKRMLFDKIGEISSKQADIIIQIQKTGKNIELENNLPNIGITLNNKIVELQHEFQKAGISIYSQKDENSGFEGASFIGEAIIEDLTDYTAKGTQNSLDYAKTMTDTTKKKVEQIEALKKVSTIRRIFAKIKRFLAPKKQEDISYTKEEKNAINVHLSNYKDTDNQLWDYNLRDNVISSIVRKIREEGYGAYTVPGLLKESINPDLEKLGLSDLIPKLQDVLVEEYKKDLPDLETYKVSKEDIGLYVPDFNKKNQKDNEFTQTDLEELYNQTREELDENKKTLKGVKTNLRKNGIVLDDLALVDESVNASERQMATKAIQKELHLDQENSRDKIQDDSDVFLG